MAAPHMAKPLKGSETLAGAPTSSPAQANTLAEVLAGREALSPDNIRLFASQLLLQGKREDLLNKTITVKGDFSKDPDAVAVLQAILAFNNGKTKLEIHANLSNANLSNTNFTGVSFVGANLSGAKFVRANFS